VERAAVLLLVVRSKDLEAIRVDEPVSVHV